MIALATFCALRRWLDGKFFASGDRGKIDAKQGPRILRILDRLDASAKPGDMEAVDLWELERDPKRYRHIEPVEGDHLG